MIITDYVPSQVARGLRVVDRATRGSVYERTRETIGSGKWRLFVNKSTFQVLLQQLSLPRDELRLHSFMTAPLNIAEHAICCRPPVMYEVATCTNREGIQREAFPLTAYGWDGMFPGGLPIHGLPGLSHAEEYVRATMPRVGGGEDFAFVPSWELPIVVCSPSPGGDVGNLRSGHWTCTVEAQSGDVVVGCEWCCGVSGRSSRFWIRPDGHYPAHCPRFYVMEFYGIYVGEEVD